MYNITLVCTHHSEYGKSNSDELYRIIDSIKPDIIFEELNQDLFHKFYEQNIIPFDPPEVKSVRRYIKEKTTIHIPVDIDINDTLTTSEIKNMFDKFKQYKAYLKLEEYQKELIYQEGYDFLNSKKCEELVENLRSIEKGILEFQINNDRISRLHELFYAEQNKREIEIIRNIYKFSEKMEYNQAVLLIGSGHRKTIFEKMKMFKSESNLKLNWALYGD